jgi:AbrB family looped-hinge helix DNA binding protein
MKVSLDDKGRITIPLELRQKLGLRPGEDINLSLINNNLLLRKSLTVNEFQELSRDDSFGIGGRDASILATMNDQQVECLATHDKNLLSIPDFYRIDPVFSPPLILPLGQEFDPVHFKSLLC